LRPILRESGANDGEEAEDGGEEDGPPTSEEVVKRVRAPAATGPVSVDCLSENEGHSTLT